MTANLTGLTEDLDVLVLDGAQATDCIAAGTQGGTTSEAVPFAASSGTFYRIVVDGWTDGVSGPYTLSLACGTR